MSSIKFTSFPQTEPPPEYVHAIVSAFRAHESDIATESSSTGLVSDKVLSLLADDLAALGFQVERSKRAEDQIDRPVFFGENGEPTLRYRVDAFHPEWRCGLEIEAGRAFMGNAFYRDLVQGLVMVQVEHLVIAVPNRYRYKSSGRESVSNDYHNGVDVAAPLFGHSRFRLPYGLTVLGY